jgi:hypothetical protein
MCFELHSLLFLLALIVRAKNKPTNYDSDDELINWRQQDRPPLLSRQQVPNAGAIDLHPNINDAWRCTDEGEGAIFNDCFFNSLYFIVLQILHIFVLTSMHTNYSRGRVNRGWGGTKWIWGVPNWGDPKCN